MEYVAAVCSRGFNGGTRQTIVKVKHSKLFRVSNEMCQPVADPGRDTENSRSIIQRFSNRKMNKSNLIHIRKISQAKEQSGPIYSEKITRQSLRDLVILY